MIVIIGIVSAVAIPRLLTPTTSAEEVALMTDFRTIREAAVMCRSETGAWPEDVDRNVMPPELEPYLDPRIWTKATPLGDHYDWNVDWGAFPMNISVVADPIPIDAWRAFDERYDDGDLDDGFIRRHNMWLCMKIE